MATDFDTARDQYENYRWCYDSGHSDWVARARQNFDFWNGEQWSAADRAALAAAGRPALTFNVIESLVRSLEGMQCALRNDVRFLPSGDGADLNSAKVRDAVWLHTQQMNQLDFLESEVYKKGLVLDRAYYDSRVEFDETTLQGNIVITSPRSQDVLLDPSADVYTPERWPQVIQRRWVSYQDIKALYGKDAAESVKYAELPGWMDYEDAFMAQQMGMMPYYRYDVPSDDKYVRGHLLLERQRYCYKRKDVFVDLQTGDMSEIPETWDRNRISHVLQTVPGVNTMRREVRTVEWIVTSDCEVLHREDSPYRQFTIVPYFPNFMDGVSKGAVGSLLDPQMLFNKITSQELHIINTTANSGWKVKRGSLKNMTIEELEEVGSRSGFVAELDDIGNMEKIQPNQTPQGHDRLSFKADQIMRNIAGVSNQARGFAREDVAGEAILANQAAQEINSASWLNNLHRTKQMLAGVVVDQARAFYTETRTLQIVKGSVFKPSLEEVTINQPMSDGSVLNDITLGRYTTALIPAPSRTTMEEADFKMLLELRKLGIGIPDEMLIELSPAANKAKIIEALRGDSNDAQARLQELEAQQAALEQQLSLAKARKEEAAAVLNQARAEKAAADAAIDPDAAYERVETRRIATENQQFNRKLDLDKERLEFDKQSQQQDVALRLTELDHDRETAVAVAKAKPAPKQPAKKPGSKKGKK